VGRSEQRAFGDLMVVLIGRLPEWQYQPDRRGASLEKMIRAQRKEFAYNLEESPSLRVKLQDGIWLDMVWAKAATLAATETGLDCFTDAVWSTSQDVLELIWLPE